MDVPPTRVKRRVSSIIMTAFNGALTRRRRFFSGDVPVKFVECVTVISQDSQCYEANMVAVNEVLLITFVPGCD